MKNRKRVFWFLLIGLSFSMILESFSQDNEEKDAVVMGLVHKQSLASIQEEERILESVPAAAQVILDFPVYGVSYSRDDKFLITADKNGGIRFWDTGNNYSLDGVLEGHTKEIYDLDISDDGKYLASGGKDQLIKIWDISGKKLIKTIRDYMGTISSLKFSPDNSVLASANLQNVIELWAVEGESFHHVTTISGPEASIYCLSFYPDGAYLASGGRDKEIRIWPLGVDDKLGIITDHTHLVLDIAFSPRGKLFASGGADNAAHLWEVSIKDRKIDFGAGPVISYIHKGWVTKVGFSSDERFFLTGSQHGRLHIWDLSQKKLVKIIDVFPNESMFDFAFSYDGKYLAAAGKGGSVNIYNWQDLIYPSDSGKK